MKFLQKIGLVKKDEEEEEVAVPQQNAMKPQYTTFGPGSTPSPGIQQAPVSSNNDYNKVIDDEIKGHSKPGLGYVSFVTALRSLSGQPIDDRTKYAVTFPTYQGQGITADNLVLMAQDAKQAIAGLVRQFDQSIQQQRKTDITDKQQRIEAEKAEIQRLTTEIQAKTTNVQTWTNEVSQSNITLSSEEAAFNNSVAMKTAEIENHISNIKLYLNATTPTK